MQRLGVYIHWPFCRSKCPYCDFFSRVKKNIPQNELINNYLQDLEYYRSLNDDYKVETIFFGGGTPSLIEPKNIAKIIDKINSLWSCSSNLEISLEANPNSNRPELFADLSKAGINRLSLGVQALNDQDLKFFGRTHSLRDAYQAIDMVLQNFSNHSIDLIYARPNQEKAKWVTELKQAVGFGFKHLSLYQLTIEEGTVFAKKGITPLEEEKAAEFYQLSTQILADNKYFDYEVSNYAKHGFACQHNLGYWQGYDYVGVGEGAVGSIHSHEKKFSTTHPLLLEELTRQERAEELILMGLRLSEGIDKNRFYQQSGSHFDEVINQSKLLKLVENKLVVNNHLNVRTTSEGRLLLDYIIRELCSY